LYFRLSLCLRTLVQQGYLNGEDLSSKFDGLTEAHLKLNEAISEDLANRALQPDTTTLEGNLVDHFKEMERNIQDRIDAFSDEISLDRFQQEQEIRSLYRSSIGSPGARPTLIDLSELRSDPGSPISYGMASICNSLSNIAASLSGLSASHQNCHQGTQINNETTTKQVSQISDVTDLAKSLQVQFIEWEWGCDSLSGIGSAEVGGRCLYCGKEHFFEGLDDSHLFGKHLVYDHSFGKCDLDSTFKTWPEMQAHLRQFHRADNWALTRLGSETAERLFRRVKQQNEHHPHFHDIAESFPQKQQSVKRILNSQISVCKLNSYVRLLVQVS
jgi:hypothetical protein